MLYAKEFRESPSEGEDRTAQPLNAQHRSALFRSDAKPLQDGSDYPE
jgi:hypothetical protein